MYILWVLIALILAIILDWKCHINMGLTSLVAAFIIGCFGMGMSPSALKAMIPVKVIFPITAITLFYGFALENGTLPKLVRHVVYQIRNRSSFIPVVLFFLCVMLGMAGIDAGSITAIMAPIAMSFVTLGDFPALPVSVSVLLGATVGSDYMFSTGGSIMRGIIESSELASNAFHYIFVAYLHELVLFAILFLAVFFATPKKKTVMDFGAPEPFDKKQKITLVLIGLFVLLTILPTVLGDVYPIPRWKSSSDVGCLALVFALAAAMLKLGTIDTVLKNNVPWKTMFMVSGVTILMGVGNEAGMTDVLVSLLNNMESKHVVVAGLALISGLFSLFSSAISVVIPTLFPLVPACAAVADIPPVYLYTAISMGASITAMSPFSTGGSIMVSNCADDIKRERLVFQQLLFAMLGLLAVVCYCFLLPV